MDSGRRFLGYSLAALRFGVGKHRVLWESLRNFPGWRFCGLGNRKSKKWAELLFGFGAVAVGTWLNLGSNKWENGDARSLPRVQRVPHNLATYTPTHILRASLKGIPKHAASMEM